jgi:hypothetical protein
MPGDPGGVLLGGGGLFRADRVTGARRERSKHANRIQMAANCMANDNDLYLKY